MKTKTVTMKLNDSVEIICDILFTYHSDNFNNDYAIFKDRETNQISAFSYTLNKQKEFIKRRLFTYFKHEGYFHTNTFPRIVFFIILPCN